MTENMMERSNLSTRGRVKRFTAFMLILAMLITGLPVSGFNLKEVKAADPPETGEYTGGMQYYDYMTQKWSEFLWYRSFESLWEAAVSHPGQQVYVKLFKDVKADNTKYRSFGKGKGFKDGAIYVPKGSSIRLDLAGHMIDRHLTLYDLSDPRNYWKGYSVIRVDEDSTLTVEDSKPYVQHDGYYDEDLGVWFPQYRYNDLVTYPSKKINLNRVVPIYGGIICGGAATYGGGISNSSRNAGIILEGGNIVGNVAKYGGGLGDDCARVWIKGGTIAYNYAAENGGGVFTKSAENKWRDVGDDSQDLLMTGGVIMRNTCKNQGGGVYADCTDHAISLSRKVMQFNDGVICANYANEGGGLFQNQGRVELNGGLINGNWAKKSGGGVYANGYMDNLIQGRDNLLVINGATITENTANWGGGLYVNTKKCKIGSATITNNEARYGAGLPGGGIYIADQDFLQFTGGKIIVQDNVQTPTGARSNISCENLNDFNGEHNYNHTLGSGSCVYVNFRNKTLVEGLTFGDYLSGTPGTIQLDDDRFYAVPNEDSARYWVVMKNYYQNWRIKMKVGNEPAAAVGDKEYSYKDKTGKDAKAIAKRGEVGYASVIDMRDMRTSYYYTDAYFRTYQDGSGANVYDHHLATMSAALAMSAFRRPYKGAENQGKNVRELMENLGMSDIELTYPEPARKGDNDYTIGYAIGKKTLTEGDNKGKTLITIATRGANYMTEWGSNTTLNYKDYFKRQAAGFSDAADKVTQGVSDYLSKHNLNGKNEEIVFWITGYSRGGATANLTAQRLTDRYNGNENGDGNRVYAYPIEAPQGAYQRYASGTGYGNRPEKEPKEYKNIHNIINPSDLVPLVAPAAMGFSRFGVDHLIPGNTDLSDNSPLKIPYVAYSENGINTAYKTTKEEMVKQLAAIDTRIGFSDRFQHSTMSFINSKISGHDMINLNGDMDAPENWYGGFLQGLLHYALISDPDEKKSSTVPQITYRTLYSEAAPVGLDANGVPRFAYGDRNAEKVSVQTAIETAIVLVFGLDDETSKKLTDRLGRCSVALDKGFKCSDGETLDMGAMYTGFIRKWKGLKTYEKNAKIKELWELVSLAGLDSVLSKQQYTDFRKIFPVLVDFAMKSVSWDWEKANSNNLGTLLANAETIAEAHYPEVNLAWLRAQDSFFKNDGKDIYIGRRVVFDPVQAIDTKITNKDGKTAKKSQDAEVYDTYLEDEIRLNLSTKTSGAKILYTLNGEDPKLRSYGVKVYDSPIRLTSKQGVRKLYNIRMVACKDGVYSPETNYRCDVYPGGDKYTLTVRYEGDRSETFRLRKGDTIELFKTTKDRTYKWKSWDLVSYSGSGGSENSDDYDWDEMSKKKDAELKKLIKEDGQRSTKLEMPAKDVEIEGVYVKLADNVHLQYEPHTRFTKDSKVEWCVETEEENFCSPGYVLPADADEGDYTIVDAYPRLYVYGNGSYGQLIQLEFVPSAMSEDMPEFTDISLDEDVPDDMFVAASADGVMDLYINDVYVANGTRHKTDHKGDGTPYGIIEAINKNSEMCARVSFEEFPLISAEFGKTDHLFVFENGTKKEDILTKFPEFTSFKSGGCSYLIKNIWPDDLLKNYDPNKSSTQKFEIYAQPDEKDFADRYPNLNTGDLKIFEKYRTVKPKCTISVKGYANAYIPWIYIERAQGDSGEGTKSNPYTKDVSIRIKNSRYNEGLKNCTLHYSVDGGKTYETCSENEVVIQLNNPKTDKDGCATICAYVTADKVWGGGSSPRVQKFYIKPTRNVNLNLALLSGMFKSRYGTRWTVSENGLGGTIKASPANESVFLNGVMYYSKYKDIGLIRQYEIRYGNKDPEIKEVKNRYSGLELIKLGDITRDAHDKIEDVTISGIYDLGIDKVKLELDEDRSVDKIWVHTYVDENGNRPSDELIELDEDKYEAEPGENPNEIIIKLKEGEGYSWCSTGTIKKADDDTVIGSLNAKDGTCSYELRAELCDEDKVYPVWIGLTAEDDPSGNDYVLEYFKKGETVNLTAPDWESHTFRKWTAPEGITITDPYSADSASFTMSENEVKISAEYDCYKNIDKLTLTIPRVLPYNELPDGSTAGVEDVDGKVVATASFEGWQDKVPGFNREIKAVVKLIPQKGYEFHEKIGSDIAVDTSFKVKIGDAEAVDNAVVKASLLDDGSVLVVIKQITDKGSVASIDWRTTEISVSANAINGDEDLLGLVPDTVTVNCTNPEAGGAFIPVALAVNKSAPSAPYSPEITDYTIEVALAESSAKNDLNFGDVAQTQTYTIILTEAPLDIKSIDWGIYEDIRISKDATEDNAKNSVPGEVWATFTRGEDPTEITISVSVNKSCIRDAGTFIVTSELDIEADVEGTKGYTNTGNIPLSHDYTLRIPDYHSVFVTDGTAEGNTDRNFDKPVWVADASVPGKGELKWLEKDDVVTAVAKVKKDFRFVRWDASGISIDEEKLTDKVLCFDMTDNDVRLTAAYDKAIDDISPEISADRTRVESVNINGSGVLDTNAYKWSVSGNKVSIEIRKGCGWFFGEKTKLNENEVVLQNINRTSDYSADFIMWPEDRPEEDEDSKNIDELTLTIPKVLAYNELPDGSTAGADAVDGTAVVTVSFEGWQDMASGFNREVKAAVKLTPKKGYEFSAKPGSDVAVNTSFKVKIGDADPVPNAVVKASLLDDGSVLAVIKQTTDKGVVNSVEWGTTSISVCEDVIESNEDLLGLVPEKIIVKCNDPKTGEPRISVVIGVEKNAPDPSYDPMYDSSYEITAVLKDSEVKLDDLIFDGTGSTQTYTITLTEKPLNVKSIDWGIDDVIRVSKDTTEDDAKNYVPGEVWTTFTREDDTEITISVPVKKQCTNEMGTFIVTAELDIETDDAGTEGYTNTGNIPLTHMYSLEVPEYHSVYVTDGTAEGNTDRSFDKPVWVTDAASSNKGELKWLEKDDLVTAVAAVKTGCKFVKWDVSGIILDEDELTDNVLCFGMTSDDVSLTAVYDKAIGDISPEISADRTRVESVTINGSGVLDAASYTANITGNKVSIELKKGFGWFFGDDTTLNENEVVIQSINKTGDYSADFVMWPETLYVALSAVDAGGTVLPGFAETYIGTYEAGNTVKAACPDIEGYKFREWSSNVEGLVLVTGEDNSVSFTMPDREVKLKAVFVPYENIGHVILKLDKPQARKALPAALISAETEGGHLDNSKTAIMWGLMESEVPDYGENVTALVTLVPDETGRFISSGGSVYTLFELEEDNEYREIDDVVLLPDGSVDLYIDFTTDKRKLASIDWGETDITGGQTITGELSNEILPDAAVLKFADAQSDEDPVLRNIIWPSLSANSAYDNSVSGNKIKKTETDEAFIYTIIGELDLSEDVGDDVTYYDEEDDEEDHDGSFNENTGWLDVGDVPLTQTFTVTLLKEPKPNKPYIDIAVSEDQSSIDVSFVADDAVSECMIHYDYAFAIDDEELNVPEPSMSDPDKVIPYNAVSVSGNKVTVSVNKAGFTGNYVTFGIKALTETRSTSEPIQTVSSNTASETVGFYIPGDRTLSVNMVDTDDAPCVGEIINPETGDATRVTSYSFDSLTAGSEVDLLAPTVKDAAFFRWEIPENVSVSANSTVVTLSGNAICEDTLSENSAGLDGGKGYTNRYITLTIPDDGEKTTVVKARFKPFVNKVSIKVDEPKADMPVTSVKSVNITFTDEYIVSNANIDAVWCGTVSRDGAEYFDPEATEYILDIELTPDTDGYITLKSLKDGTEVTRRADEIIFAPDAETIINEEVDEYAFPGTDEGIPYIVCSFDNTQMYEDLDDGPDKEAVVGSVIDNVFGIYNDEEGQYEYTFDKVNIDNSWKADISDQAGRSLYIRYRAVDDDPESKWTTIELPPANDDMPSMTYYHTEGTIGFEGVDKWQYRLNGQSEWKSAPSAIVSPDELGWDGTTTGMEVRRAGDQTRFPGRSSQIVLKARPAAPTGFTVSDNSAAIRGTVTGTFDSAAGKQIEVQVRYPDRSDDWTAYHQGRFITVDENGRFIIDKLADSRADIRIRVFEEGEMPSQWATASVRIDKDRTISDENLVEKRYSVNYVFEYGGQRLVDTTGYVYTKDLKGYDGKVYGISANREWFDERAREMFGSDSKNAIVSFVIKGRSGNSDGRAAAVAGDKESETVLATIEASKFKDNSGKVAYGSIPVDYNEITVYARIGSFATMRDTTEGVYISSPLPVGYTGLAHRLNVEPSSGKPNSGKSGSYDLELEVRDTSSTDENGDSYTLVYGKDYTVSYKNNVNASVMYDPSSGKYTPLYTDIKTAEKKSPQMTIKGKGNYRSLKAVVYFDILPLDLTAEAGSVGRFESGQIKSSYILNKNGGIKLSIKPVRYARIFDKVKGVYVTDDKKRVNYGSKDITMMLQRLDDASGSWDNVGSLDKKDAKETLKKVTTPGEYRIRYSGLGNFYGTGLYDEFNVYKHGSVLFSTLKVKTSKMKYSSGGVSANELVTGISTKVKDSAGNKVKLTPEDYSVSLMPVSDSAVVTDNRAMSAGTYKAQVWYGDISEKYPGLMPDNPIEVTVNVTGEKLKSNMVTLDWNAKGEDYTGTSRDVKVQLNGAKASEVTLAKRIIKDGKEQFVPMTDAEFTAAVKEVGEDSLTVKGTYELSDGSKTDNTLPGKYTITLFGKGKYGGSVLTKTYKRLPVKLTPEMLKASDTAFNIGGVETEISISSNAIGLDEMTFGKGDDDYSVTYSGVKKATVSGNMIGTATATVKVKSETTGLKKGSSAKVTFNVYERSAYILRYADYSYADPGALYIQVAGDVKSGSKPPKLTLYQSSEDGTRLKKIPEKYYTASFTREAVVEGYESAAPSYSVKISAGREKGYDFTAKGITTGSVYSEYKNKAKKWGNIKLSGKAVVIPDEGDGMSYTDRNMDSYASAMINVDTTGKMPAVSYVGNSYILPVVDEVVVDGITLKRADGDFIVTYKKNNKPGTAGMTITLTPGHSDTTMSYPLGGSKTFNFKIIEQKNKDLKL